MMIFPGWGAAGRIFPADEHISVRVQAWQCLGRTGEEQLCADNCGAGGDFALPAKGGVSLQTRSSRCAQFFSEQRTFVLMDRIKRRIQSRELATIVWMQRGSDWGQRSFKKEMLIETTHTIVRRLWRVARYHHLRRNCRRKIRSSPVRPRHCQA